jgi:hypothetical protein
MITMCGMFVTGLKYLSGDNIYSNPDTYLSAHAAGGAR